MLRVGSTSELLDLFVAPNNSYHDDDGDGDSGDDNEVNVC